MTLQTGRNRLWTRWLTRSVGVLLVFWIAAILTPQLLGLAGPWRALGAGLVLPGSGLLYAIPGSHHSVDTAMVIGHAALMLVELICAAWLLRKFGWVAAAGAAVVAAVVVAGCFLVPYAVVVTGHVVGFVTVLIACGWAFGIRLIARADSVTLAVIIAGSTVAGAALTALHADHPGPLTGIPWIALAVAIAALSALGARAWSMRRAARRRGAERQHHLNTLRAGGEPPSARTRAVGLQTSATEPEVTEASLEQVRFLRYLLSVAAQPADVWDGFDDEAQGPLQQYRYQVNALGWALAIYNYSHTPSYTGVLTAAQLALFERAQQKAVWGYWYWQNLLGNWDFVKRRADPIDVPQNIMFSGYLNLQLAMYRQATGDDRFDEPEALVFDWSARQRFGFDHQRVNAIAIRNFDQDLCLWPCEPVVSRGRTRGYVFPYCNAVTIAGIAIMDTVNGTGYAPGIARNIEMVLEREYTRGVNDLAAFIVSGVGLAVRSIMAGPTVTAGIAAFMAPFCPDLAWRAWEVMKLAWLETGLYRDPDSAGKQMPDWSTGAETNAEPLAAAMMLAHAVGEDGWHAELWKTAVEQLQFTAPDIGRTMAKFDAASVHANGMLGFGGMSRPGAFSDMLTEPRPKQWQDGPRLVDAPHPDVLVAKAVTDGHGLDLVIHPGRTDQRVGLDLDRLRPNQRYLAHGAVEALLEADVNGTARVIVDVAARTHIQLRPV